MKEATRLYSMKRYDMALKEFLSDDPDAGEESVHSYYLGLCYTQLGRYDEALLHLEQVVTSDLDFLHVYQCRMVLAYIYSVTRRYRLAELELKQLLSDGYESTRVYAALGYNAYRQKRMDESVEYLRKALDLDPENATALNSLGFILADERIDSAEGLALCRRAVALNPQNPAYLDSLGWAYYRNGNLR